MKGARIFHNGTELSFQMKVSKDGKIIAIKYEDGTKKSFSVDGSPIDMCCPSVEGTVIICYLENGKVSVLDSKSGKHLTTEEIKGRKISVIS